MEQGPLSSDSMEETLRRRLTSLADGAPAVIPDLDRELARRVARVRRQRLAVLGGSAVAVLVCGAGLGGAWALSARNSPPRAAQGLSLSPPQAGRAEPTNIPRDSLQCPQDLGTFTLESAHPGLGAAMVPGTPVEAVICGYAASTGPPVIGMAGAIALTPLIAQLNAASVPAGGACAATQAGRASKILIRFRYQAGAEVDVLVTLSGTKCPSETNGVLRGSLPAALTIPYLDDLGQNITPPPTPWTTPPGTVHRASGPEYASPSSSPREPLPSSSSPYTPVPPSPSAGALRRIRPQGDAGPGRMSREPRDGNGSAAATS